MTPEDTRTAADAMYEHRQHPTVAEHLTVEDLAKLKTILDEDRA